MKNYLSIGKFLRQNKNYIWFATLIFLIFTLVGYFFPIFFRQEIINMITQLSEKIKDYNAFELVLFIISNNFTTSFLGVIIGIFLGIFPIIILIVNGYILGFVANAAVSESSLLVLWRLLPHGIFELPAVIISMALGIKLGVSAFSGLFGKNKKFKKDFFTILKILFLVVLPLLILAGIIEGVLIYFLK